MSYVKILSPMTDNIDRLLKAIEHPEDFTDHELEEILNDPETRDVYRMMTKAEDTLCEPGTPDTDREWHKFSSSHIINRTTRKRAGFHTLLSRRKAAIITAIVVAAGAVAAGIGMKMTSGDKASRNAETSVATIENKAVAAKAEKSDTILTLTASVPDTIVFKDEKLDRIVSEIAKYYGAGTSFRKPGTGKLRLFFKWDQSLGLPEVIEQLNAFEQIDIKLEDNLITVE